MAVYELTLPLDDATVEKLQVGDIIYLNGQVCTARDIAHLKLRELADAGKSLSPKTFAAVRFFMPVQS